MSSERVDPAQRAAALGVLNRALDEGRLPLEEYDTRVAAISSATYVPELAAQVERFGWQQPAPVARPAPYGRTALVLGLVSLPLAVCVIGLVPGVLAVLYSIRASRAGDRGFGASMIGRVFGIIGVVLSLATGFALGYALTHRLGP